MCGLAAIFTYRNGGRQVRREALLNMRAPHAKVAAMEMSHYMRNMLLRDADWARMAHSLEIRTPMVDIALFRALAPYLSNVNYAPSKKMLGGVPKRSLPNEIIQRPKTGFSIPVNEWLKANDGFPFKAGHIKGLTVRPELVEGWTVKPIMVRQALKKQLFCICKINDLRRYKNTKNCVKQRLFPGNAMRPKGAYFAHHERLNLKLSRLKREAQTTALTANAVCAAGVLGLMNPTLSIKRAE